MFTCKDGSEKTKWAIGNHWHKNDQSHSLKRKQLQHDTNIPRLPQPDSILHGQEDMDVHLAAQIGLYMMNRDHSAVDFSAKS